MLNNNYNQNSEFTNIPSLCSELPQVHLAMGKCIVLQGGAMIHTVLGSCVAVTFRHHPSGHCAMFHAILPSNPDGPSCTTDIFRYVDSSIFRVLSSYSARGIRPHQIDVKLFGGAYSLERNDTPSGICDAIDVGARNVELAKKILLGKGMRIRKQDTRGSKGRKILFNSLSGEVWLKRLAPVSPQVRSQGEILFQEIG